MESIDERIVRISFDNKKFEARVSKTLGSLTKLNESLKKIGPTKGFGDIDKAANKVSLAGPMSALDKLKAKLGFGRESVKAFGDLETASGKVKLDGPVTALDKIKMKLGFGAEAPKAFGDIETSANKVTLRQPLNALDKLRSRLFGAGEGAAQGMSDIDRAGNKVTLEQPIQALNKVQSAVANVGVNATDGFNGIQQAANRVTFQGLHSAIDSVTAKFSILQGAAAVALGNIISQATMRGASFIKSFGFGPINDGLAEYTTNLKSIQTIQANTDRPLTEINASLQELNRYSDQTIYNFSEMARNIGTFTAAGVDLKTATSSIKGIANLAALAGSSSQQASTAMYQLSQAISSGRVSLQDWNSVVNAGMGGKKLQTALATTAIAMGDIEERSVKLEGPMKKLTINGQSFRESIMSKPGEEPWLSSEILVNTLATLDGRFSKAALSAERTEAGLRKYSAAQVEASIADARASLEKKNGVKYTEEQFKALRKLSDNAFKSATEVKTLGQVFDVARETIGSGWAASFQNIFGTLTEAKKTFTDLSGVINGFINANSLARNTVLADWKKMGGRTAAIEGIKNVFQGLISVVKPVGDAFRDIFPRKTGEDLFLLSAKFEDFTEKLKIGPETAKDLKRTFSGFFAVLSIGKTIVGEILGVFGDLVGAAKDGSGGFLSFTGGIGDFVVSLDEALKKSEEFKNFFDKLGQILAAPITILGKLSEAFGSLFEGGGDSENFTDQQKALQQGLTQTEKALNGVMAAWRAFLGVMGDVKTALEPVLSEIGKVFGKVGDVIGNAFENANFDNIFDVIQTTLIGGIFLAIKKGLGKGVNIDLGGGVLNNLSESFTTLTKSLKAMQHNLQAKTLLTIAIAVGVLAAGITALSLVDPKNLASAMTAIAVGLGELVGAIFILTKVGGASFATLPFIAASLILLALAINTLALAVFAFSKLDWQELGKGLAGVAGSLAAIGLGVKLIPPSVILIGPALIPLAIALNILAIAMKVFATMSWEEMAKGLIGVAGGLTAIGLATKLMGPSIFLIGPGLIGVAVALNLLAGAVLLFGNMDLETMGKGLLGIGGALVVIGFAIRTIPKTVALQAAGLILLGIALTSIAGAIAVMGNLSIETLAKGIGGLGLALFVLAAGLKAMIGGIPGSVALLTAATALAILVPVLGVLGNMNLVTLAIGLGAIAATLGVLALAGTFAAPGIYILGGALLGLGAAVTLVGFGVYLFTAGLIKLGGDGSKAIAALIAAFTAFILLIPKVIINFMKGIVEIAAALVRLAPDIVKALANIVIILLDVIIKAAPKMAEAVGALISAFLTIIVRDTPKIIAAGVQIMVSFLQGVSEGVVKIVPLVGEIIFNFLNALTAEIPRIIAAGANVLIKFLLGLAQATPRIVTSAVTLITRFLNALTTNIPRLALAGARMVAEFIQGIADNIGKVISAGGNLIVKIIEGIGAQGGKIASAGARTIGNFLAACAQAMLDLTSRIATVIVNFLDGLAKAIRTHGPRIRRAGWNVASAIIEGLVAGLTDLSGKVGDVVENIINAIPNKVKSILGIKSPSSIFHSIGTNVMLGLANGLDSGGTDTLNSVEETASGLISSMRNHLSAVPDILDGLMDVDPTITPVLDLTNVEAGAKKIGDLTNVTPITAAVSFTQASVISSDQQAIAKATAEEAEIAAIPTVSFEQNNYSPEALSEIEIYRRTNNQVSKIKSVIGI